jgi:hypothetical protein
MPEIIGDSACSQVQVIRNFGIGVYGCDRGADAETRGRGVAAEHWVSPFNAGVNDRDVNSFPVHAAGAETIAHFYLWRLAIE